MCVRKTNAIIGKAPRLGIHTRDMCTSPPAWNSFSYVSMTVRGILGGERWKNSFIRTLRRAASRDHHNCAPSLFREHRKVSFKLFLVMIAFFFSAVSPCCTRALLLTVTPCFISFLSIQLFLLFFCQHGIPSTRISLTHCNLL